MSEIEQGILTQLGDGTPVVETDDGRMIGVQADYDTACNPRLLEGTRVSFRVVRGGAVIVDDADPGGTTARLREALQQSLDSLPRERIDQLLDELRWRDENCEALESSNAYVEQQGGPGRSPDSPQKSSGTAIGWSPYEDGRLGWGTPLKWEMAEDNELRATPMRAVLKVGQEASGTWWWHVEATTFTADGKAETKSIAVDRAERTYWLSMEFDEEAPR